MHTLCGKRIGDLPIIHKTTPISNKSMAPEADQIIPINIHTHTYELTMLYYVAMQFKLTGKLWSFV